MDPYEIIYHPHVTEKTMDLMEKNNALEFVVKRNATKKQIKNAIEKMFEVKVKKVNTKITKNGKHAIVMFPPEYKAEEIGMRIGVF
ncbi:MAG: 50S ribosomal protein L23 [Thermoplasmata archaeon]|nr:MAG: 50S ribosomal protein L23 [Thermoplasmata archaeon]HEC86583.1 50S ribosomal protein L23 [Thermoplasmatales archaeon]